MKGCVDILAEKLGILQNAVLPVSCCFSHNEQIAVHYTFTAKLFSIKNSLTLGQFSCNSYEAHGNLPHVTLKLSHLILLTSSEGSRSIVVEHWTDDDDDLFLI